VNDRNSLTICSLNEVVSMLADVKKYATFDKANRKACDVTSIWFYTLNITASKTNSTKFTLQCKNIHVSAKRSSDL
jgi:hypothetical protein